MHKVKEKNLRRCGQKGEIERVVSCRSTEKTERGTELGKIHVKERKGEEKEGSCQAGQKGMQGGEV